MFASAHILHLSPEFVTSAIVDMACREALVAAHDRIEDGMLDDFSVGLLDRLVGDDGLDYFVDQKRDRRAAYHCRGNRFGGDVGNRKRRYRDDRKHANKLEAERKATQQAIEDGLFEYETGEFRHYDLPRGHNKRRGKRGGTSRSLSGFGPRVGDDRPQDGSTCVQQQRFGRQVVVTVLKKGATRLERKAAMASIAGTLPKLETSGIKAKMGLTS